MDLYKLERLLWRHIKFIRDNWKDIVDDTSQMRLIILDSKSKPEVMDPWPQKSIDMLFKAHNDEQKRYTGMTSSKKRRGHS